MALMAMSKLTKSVPAFFAVTIKLSRRDYDQNRKLAFTAVSPVSAHFDRLRNLRSPRRSISFFMGAQRS
jgi:hypothetical protein